MESEKDIFLEMLSKEIEVDGSKYKYVDYTAEGGKYIRNDRYKYN